jgi:hypothetical protein
VAGKYLPTSGAEGSAACIACPSNFGSAAGSSACQCNTGYTGSTCIACVAGKYKPVTGSGACTDCGVGKYSVTVDATAETACLSCPGVSTSAQGSSSSSACQCNTGYTGSTCIACVAGKYKTVTGPVACTDCGAGKYSAMLGATAEAVCLVCPGVSTSTADRTSCQCNAGYTGSTCIACVAGKYKPVTGSGACTDCGAGKYSTLTGATAETCTVCPAGKSSLAGSDMLDDCVGEECEAGSTGPNGGPCSACVAGKYKGTTGSADCTNCGAGKYSATIAATTETTCLTCPGVSTSAQGSVSSSACQCNAGYTGSTCAACVAGKYKSVTGADSCNDCATGKYSATMAAIAEAACLTCPGVSTSSTDRTSCQCNAGYTGTFMCSACEAGTYKELAGNEACTNCVAGKFSTVAGGTTASLCELCEMGKTSTAGSSSCHCAQGYSEAPFPILTCSGQCACDPYSNSFTGNYQHVIPLQQTEPHVSATLATREAHA